MYFGQYVGDSQIVMRNAILAHGLIVYSGLSVYLYVFGQLEMLQIQI